MRPEGATVAAANVELLKIGSCAVLAFGHLISFIMSFCEAWQACPKNYYKVSLSEPSKQPLIWDGMGHHSCQQAENATQS